MTDQIDVPAGTVFAGCKIIVKLGQGGMGTVYKAHQEALDKFVCVKLLSPELAREKRNIEFFLREARSAAKLDHPNIVHIYNFGQENGAYFIVMSYVEGKSLQDLVAEKGPLPVGDATKIMTGVLEGLAHAHAKSVIHRDIKPANILVGPDNVPRIVDFGLARSISEEKQLTMAGEMVGTAYFMSPEQGLAGVVDNRADLYAAGATYFYILTGKYPFEGKSSIEVIHKHIGEPVPNVILLRPDVPLWAARVIERLMHKKPEDRYQKAKDVIADLEKYSSGETSLDSVSAERTFDIPEVTARMAAVPPPPPRTASLESAAATISDHYFQPPDEDAEQKEESDQEPVEQVRPPLQLDRLHNAVKITVHLALTLAGTACFILAGAAGKVSGSLSSPLATNPVAAMVLAAAGFGLFSWAILHKPRKFTALYAFFSAAAAAAAYAGGAFIPAPEGADLVAKGVLAITISAMNVFTSSNLIVYALFLYLGASKMVYKKSRLLKGLAAAFYLAGLGLTYLYFRAGADLSPDTIWLAAGGVLALLGLIAALVQKEFSLLFSPQLIFLAANLTMFAIFTNPRVEAITVQQAKADAVNVARLNAQSRADYQRALDVAQSEALYDVEGRPIPRNLPSPPAELKPAETGMLRNQARLEYYKVLSVRISADLADSAGIIFISLFLTLMANACFIEELLAAYAEHEF